MGSTQPDRRERAERMRKERERTERRRRNLVTAGIVGVVVVLVAVAAIAINSANDDESDSAGSDFPADGIVFDQKAATGESSNDDPVDVVVYADFQCPHCASFDTETRDLVSDYVEDGTIRIAYELLNYIDQGMGGSTEYSMRAANAATCVYDEGGGQAFHEFASMLFDNQKVEGSAGFTDKELTAYAEQVGVDDLGACLRELPHQQEIEKRTRRFATSEVGSKGTPAVVVDGELLATPTADALQAAIEDAA